MNMYTIYNKMQEIKLFKKYFSLAISGKAFVLALIFTAIPIFNNASFDASVEGIVITVTSIITGGVFWGWLLTKFLPKYFK